jgi:hypothetical protein
VKRVDPPTASPLVARRTSELVVRRLRYHFPAEPWPLSHGVVSWHKRGCHEEI